MAIGVAVVGLGGMGNTHLRGLLRSKRVNVVAVCDPNPAKLRGDLLGSQVDVHTGEVGVVDVDKIKRYVDFIELLTDPDVELIVLCVPTYLHAKMTRQALQSGKHVFCEKPMALNRKETASMLDAAEKTGKKLMIGQCLRFWPEYILLKNMIDDGRFGKVTSAVFRRFGALPDWSGDGWMSDVKKSGSAALSLHIHDTDTVLWFFGKPKGVTSFGYVERDGSVHHLITSYRYKNFPMVCAEGGWLPGDVPFTMTVKIVFDLATVEYDLNKHPTTVIYHADGTEEPADIPNGYGHDDELAYFVNCIEEDIPPLQCLPADSALSVKIVEAEIESAKKQKSIDL
ncbi:MAG: Gfo/Idh/MocA family oxidoreductase [Phycisphaerae bacterium]|nr:Gfo/Idh/MocA family oxidoreductase [Phycisphaerae bacterium]